MRASSWAGERTQNRLTFIANTLSNRRPSVRTSAGRRSSSATVRRTARPASTWAWLRLVARAIAVADRSTATTCPPPEVVELLSALDRPALPGVRWSTPEQWMVKLRPLGHVQDRVVAPLREALAAELDGAPAVACRLGPATRRVGGAWAGGAPPPGRRPG